MKKRSEPPKSPKAKALARNVRRALIAKRVRALAKAADAADAVVDPDQADNDIEE